LEVGSDGIVDVEEWVSPKWSPAGETTLSDLVLIGPRAPPALPWHGTAIEVLVAELLGRGAAAGL
jgi:hypothetical protein